MRHIEDGIYRDRQDVLQSDLRDARSVGAFAFANCTQLEAVYFSNGLAVICEDAFFGCKSLEEVTLPDGCITLGERAFAQSGLRHIDLPETLQIIGNSCFEDCENLTEIHLGQSLHTLGASAFSGCRKLHTVTLPDLPSVRDGCFAQTAVEEVCFPDRTQYIGRDAFSECKDLRLISLPSGDIRLRGSAFAGCDQLCHVIRRHKYGEEHRVFLKPPKANDITRKLSSYDKSVKTSPQALFRLSHPHALMADDRARFESILQSDIASANQYLFSMQDILPAEDFNKALQILTLIDPSL